MPNTRPQCTSVPGMVPIMLASPIWQVDGLLRLAGSRSGTFDEMVQQRDGDVGQQQAGDRLVDAAVLAQRARQRDPQAAGDHAGAAPSRLHDSGGAPVHGERHAGGARARRPDSAPSPPMITSPSRAGSAVQSAVRISGAARVSVFCQENQVPKAPWYMRRRGRADSCRTAATKMPNTNSAPISGRRRGSAMSSIAVPQRCRKPGSAAGAGPAACNAVDSLRCHDVARARPRPGSSCSRAQASFWTDVPAAMTSCPCCP